MTAAMMAALSGLPGTGYASNPVPTDKPIQKIEAAIGRGIGAVNKAPENLIKSLLKQKRRGDARSTVTLKYGPEGTFSADLILPDGRWKTISGSDSQEFCREAASALNALRQTGNYTKFRIVNGDQAGSSQSRWIQQELMKRFPDASFSFAR